MVTLVEHEQAKASYLLNLARLARRGHTENMPEVTFSTREAAEYLKVSINRILDLIEEKRFPGAYKIRGQWKIPAEEVIHFEKQKTGRPKKKVGRPRKTRT